MNSNNCCNQDIYPTQDLERWSVSCSTPLVPASNFYTKNEIDEMLEDIEISGGCDCDFDDYYTKEEVDAGLATKLDASAYTPTDLSDYYNKQEVDGKLNGKLDASAYTPTDLSNYWTSAQTQNAINASVSGKADISDIPSLSGYATEQWVENQNYLTEHQPIKTINGISMVGTGDIEIGSGGTTDLSNYYNKQEVDAIVSGKAETSALTALNSSLTAHTSNGDIHVSQQEKSVWNAKLDASAYTPTDLSNYWTSAQTNTAINEATSGKAETSAVTAHTSNTAIHVSSNEKYNWNTAYNNYFDKNNIWCGTEAQFNTATTSGTNINPDIIYFIHS